MVPLKQNLNVDWLIWGRIFDSSLGGILILCTKIRELHGKDQMSGLQEAQ